MHCALLLVASMLLAACGGGGETPEPLTRPRRRLPLREPLWRQNRNTSRTHQQRAAHQSSGDERISNMGDFTCENFDQDRSITDLTGALAIYGNMARRSFLLGMGPRLRRDLIEEMGDGTESTPSKRLHGGGAGAGHL
ncbi:MAG: hypothetical protein H6649_08070 [Caldilineae bacterium]|nr:hypothetical protein [Caldilineae bacterium]